MKDWLVLFPDGTTTISFQILIWATRVIRKLRFFREPQDFGNISVMILALAVKRARGIAV